MNNASLHILSSPPTPPLAASLQQLLAELGAAVLAAHPFPGDIQVVCTDDEQIRQLNRQYRDKDRATDVLSFDLSDELHNCGEIYISLQRADHQARELQVPLDQELGRLMVHGLLHLAGFDHQTEPELARMEQLTDRFLHDAGLLPGVPA